ncbi:MAG TPA: hypothetical protein PLH53_02595 [Ignavibacteriaceae bacterium]|nr:hypothetical protein [Ignavibacteriaceae bacterium]
MNRKKFITSLSVASVGAAVFPFSTLQPSRSQSRVLEGFFKDEPPIIKPPRLKNGDKLALVAPGSYIAQSELQDSIKNLADLEQLIPKKYFCRADILPERMKIVQKI